jgi:hypothetical protein
VAQLQATAASSDHWSLSENRLYRQRYRPGLSGNIAVHDDEVIVTLTRRSISPSSDKPPSPTSVSHGGAGDGSSSGTPELGSINLRENRR